MNKQLVVNADYNGINVSFTGDGWFNATQAAEKFGKRPADWRRLEETRSYLKALCFGLGISEPKSLIRAKRNSGTWLHPKLAVRFAQWLDMSFAVWCDLQIDKIIRTNAAPPDVQDLMRLLLSNTVSEWELRFPDSYYFAIAKVTGTQYRGHSNGTPAVFGQITQQWIYTEIMPTDVLAEVKARKQQSEKIHQWFTNGGIALLSKQITKIQAIAESSVDYADFKSRCYQSGKSKGQLRLVYPQGGVS
jgi:hypothetical protein